MTSESNLVRLNTRSAGSNRLGLIGTAAILLSWFYLNFSILGWLAQTLLEISLFYKGLLIAGGLLLLVQAMRYPQQFRFSPIPVLRWSPVIVTIGGALLAYASRWLLMLEQLPIAFALLGTYGLLGLFLEFATWRKGLPIGAAIALFLPFGVQFTSGVGFPARILTAHIVEFILKAGNIPAISSEDIIVFDTGIAHVDLPCSGLRSLWIGTLFLLAATWLESRKFGLRWLVVFVGNLGILAIANLTRVLTLVLIAKVWNQPVFAEILHVPLGLIAFIFGCGCTWGLLRWVPRHAVRETQQPTSFPRHEASASLILSPGSASLDSFDSFPGSAWERNYRGSASPISAKLSNLKSFLLAACILGLTLIPNPPAISTSLPNLANLQWSSAIQTQPIELSPVEKEFFATRLGVVAQKQHFEFQGLTGSILFVASPTLKVHHAPEMCLASIGFRLDRLAEQQFAPKLFGRWLSLDNQTKSAVYWFQSPHQTTGDLLVRFWQQASRKESSWTLVSILFDQFHNPTDPVVQGFVTEVYQTLQKA
ncbi:MAG TPA: exosortase O [Cyanobacteria bacterium UBA11372]|nr:exosortase O [Cyanobacteria bacterium UBA11372]